MIDRESQLRVEATVAGATVINHGTIAATNGVAVDFTHSGDTICEETLLPLQKSISRSVR